MILGVCDLASEQVKQRARAKEAVRSKQMSEQGEQMSKRTSKCPCIILVDSIIILPNVECLIACCCLLLCVSACLIAASMRLLLHLLVCYFKTQ